MYKWTQYIDHQIGFNQDKNLFYHGIPQAMKFSQSTLQAIRRLDDIPEKDLPLLMDYTTEKVLQGFCRINQYFSFDENDKNDLKEIYQNLYRDITTKTTPLSTIADNHYENLKYWLLKTNPFSQKIYSESDAIVNAVACSEYSAQLQKRTLHLDRIKLSDPILDIGCGKDGNLVKSLREENLEAYGIDRFSDNSPFLKKADWLEFDYGTEKWGTIVSNLGFSNHFVHHHLRNDGVYIEYAKKFMDILRSLKIGGCFCYAPDLPFIEQFLNETNFQITKYGIDNLSFNATIITRLI